MNILFYEPMIAWVSPHFETCLELMQYHIEKGDNLSFLGCNSELEICEPNFFKKKSIICLRCISRRNNGLKLLDKNIHASSFLNIKEADKEKIHSLDFRFNNIDELKKYKIDNFDIGYAVASSLIFRLRDPNPELHKHKDLVHRLVRSAYFVYISFFNRLQENKVDRVYIFNGRFAVERGVLRACQKLKIECVLHERGSTKDKYALYYNTLPHDLDAFKKNADIAWQTADSKTRERAASQFYIDRRAGKEQSWRSYIFLQKDGLLPRLWNTKKQNIVIFQSSEFEFASIDDQWQFPIYKTQLDGLKSISKSMSEFSSKIHLWLRIHPNLIGSDDNSVSQLYPLESEYFSVIPPDSPISSYALLDAADKVVTFGSTVGIEAAFWNKVSIMLGICQYKDMGSVYLPSSHEEAIDLLLADLPPLNPEGALKYAYYVSTKGEPFKYYQAINLTEGKFRGKRVEASLSVEFLAKYAPNVVDSFLKKIMLSNLFKIIRV